MVVKRKKAAVVKEEEAEEGMVVRAGGVSDDSDPDDDSADGEDGQLSDLDEEDFVEDEGEEGEESEGEEGEEGEEEEDGEEGDDEEDEEDGDEEEEDDEEEEEEEDEPADRPSHDLWDDEEEPAKASISKAAQAAPRGGKQSRAVLSKFPLRDAKGRSVPLASAPGKEQNIDKITPESDSDEDGPLMRNPVGDIPMEWYRDEKHIGYDLSGKKIIRKPRKDTLDAHLAKADDPQPWRNVYDEVNDEELRLTDDELKLLRRLRAGKFDPGYDPYADYPDPIDDPEHKIHPLFSR